MLTLIVISLFSCKEDDDEEIIDGCCLGQILPSITNRDFKMGFTTWPYNAQLGGQDTTYAFLKANGDIYAEHIDDRIPWSAWINNTALPQDFINNIQGRKQRKINGNDLLVSVSLLNNLRTDLAEDYNGDTLAYDSLNQSNIISAYYKHIDYIVTELQPDHLVIAMEVNELLKNAPSKWDGYKKLMDSVRTQLKAKYPNLPMSESITLHNLAYNASAIEQQEVVSYINSTQDFASISFHPHIGGLGATNPEQIDNGFVFLNSNIQLPIAFVETSALAEDLIVPNLNVNIPSDQGFQLEYLKTLLLQADVNDYEFIIWWCHRDYDALWQTFPPSVKDLGQLWRDTGLLDEDGNERISFDVWSEILSR
ncbi:MAG: hypothetical protein CMP59_02220 [Flavobacteriales bacterium]|nr:hypothetical protein [Flavobacteriales bacterium]